ncbi:MAG: N-acetyl sugar amidotransferase [Candidatus Obscuribacter sp.]|nr:N-acetyl sugar amidotransferase [Candidatus Obscuribacter sp.]
MAKTLGQPLFANMQYCVRCCMPSSNEGIEFDEMGICRACFSAEQKMHINWIEREKSLRKLLDYHKSLNRDYDCIVPISGGKDSTFQLHVVTKVYGLRALAVTFSHNWFTETGKYNLQNCLEKFNVDHIVFTPNRNLVNRIARQSLVKIGDSCWHCHSGVGAFAMQIAVKFNISLLIWGESAADLSGRSSYFDPVIKFDRDYFTKMSAKVGPEEIAGDTISARELSPWRLPSVEDIERVGVEGIHLGDYIFWDDERQMEFVRDVYDWREDRVEGTYKGYKSVECIMAGVHDYTKFLKRGFGRGTDHASVDVRAGLLTREEAFELAKKHDTERPDALDYYLQITGYTEAEFEAVMLKHRHALNIKGLSDAEFAQAVEEYRSESGQK